MKKLPVATQAILSRHARDPNIRKMQKYMQHGEITTYSHCVHVAILGCKIAGLLHIDDEACINDIIIGGLLHDYFLYDWHEGRLRKEGIHCFSHPKTALINATADFDLTNKQKNIIRSHMFPATLLHPPKSIEAAIICISDKICAITEYAGWYYPYEESSVSYDIRKKIKYDKKNHQSRNEKEWASRRPVGMMVKTKKIN